MKEKIVVWLVVLVGSVLLLAARPVRAYLVDEDLGGYCPECFSDPSCDDVDSSCNYEGSKCCSPVPMSECSKVKDPTECRTSGEDAWIYTFKTACLKCTNRYRGNCTPTYEYNTKDCSASDRCEGGPNQINACQEVSDAEMFSVSNSSGHILAGQCSASDCSEEGCKNGGWFRIG